MSGFHQPDMVWALPFFSDLNDREKAELLHVASFKHLERKRVLFLQGDAFDYLYWVCKGAVQMFRETPDGHELTESICITGDLLYDPDALQQRKVHISNARAVEDATLLVVPAAWIEERIGSWDKLANKFLTFLARRAQEARIEVEHQATMNATQILACFLQHLCVSHYLDPRGFDLPYSKSLIASRLGMELESLSRALPKLREFGIHVNGKHVSFEDMAATERHSCGACSLAGECHTHTMMQAHVKKTTTPFTRKA